MAGVRKSWGWVGLFAVLLCEGCAPEANPDTALAPAEKVSQAQAVTAAGGGAAGFPAHFSYPPLQTSVEEYALEIDPKLLARFEQDEDTPEQPAIFVTPSGERRQALMRLRGNSSRNWPKKCWRVEIPDGAKFEGRRKLNLLSEWRDSTLMIEKLGYDMLEALGVPASRARYVRLTINGVFQGIYLDLERVDKSFLDNHGLADTDGSIYRCGRKNCEMKTTYDKSYQKDWEKQTNEKQPNDALKAFLDTVNYTPEPEFAAALTEKFELEAYLRELVVESLISMGTHEDSRSYVVHDAVTGRVRYVPWDYNNTDALAVPFGNRNNADYEHPLFSFSLMDGRVEEEYQNREEKEPKRFKPIFSNLNTRIVLNPELRARQMALVEQALVELLSPSALHARIDATHALLRPYMQNAPHSDWQKFSDAPRYLKKYARERTRFLSEELATWRAWKPMLVLQSVNPQQGYVELRNVGPKPVSTSGLVLTTQLRSAKKRNVPALTLQPGETVRLLQAQLGLKLEPRGEVGLFDGRSVVGVLDALYYGPLPSGQRYVRDEDPALHWQVR